MRLGIRAQRILGAARLGSYCAPPPRAFQSRRRTHSTSLCTFYKIINESVYFPWFAIMPLPSSSIRHCHPHCFKTLARNGLKYSFVLSAVNNCLLRLSHQQIYVLLSITCSCIHSCCCYLLYRTVWVTFILASSYLVFPCIMQNLL